MQSLPFPSIAPFAGVTGGASKGLIGRFVDDVVESALRPSRLGSKTPRALQALQKRLDQGDLAFKDLDKSLEQAKKIIRKILNSENAIVKQKGKNIDIFDPKTGRGVRLREGEFVTFLDLAKEK